MGHTGLELSDEWTAPVFFAALPGGRAFGEAQETDFLRAALLECLDGDAAEAVVDDNGVERLGVSTHSLTPVLKQRLRELSRQFGKEQLLTTGHYDPDVVLHQFEPGAIPTAELVLEVDPGRARLHTGRADGRRRHAGRTAGGPTRAAPAPQAARRGRLPAARPHRGRAATRVSGPAFPVVHALSPGYALEGEDATTMSKLRFTRGFHSREMNQVDLPVEIRLPNLVLVKRALVSQEVELAPGTYHVIVRLPAGQEIHREVTIEEGREPTPVVIALDREDESPRESMEVRLFLGGCLEAASTRDEDEVDGPGFEHSWFGGNPLRGECAPVEDVFPKAGPPGTS